MVLQAEPIYKALKAIRAQGAKVFGKRIQPHVIYLSPQGKTLTQKRAAELSRKSWIVLLCGHYEGIDERALTLIDEEISIGDYVLTGGELPAMVLADAVLRLIPGVVKEAGSLVEESFQTAKNASSKRAATRPGSSVCPPACVTSRSWIQRPAPVSLAMR